MHTHNTQPRRVHQRTWERDGPSSSRPMRSSSSSSKRLVSRLDFEAEADARPLLLRPREVLGRGVVAAAGAALAPSSAAATACKRGNGGAAILSVDFIGTSSRATLEPGPTSALVELLGRLRSRGRRGGGERAAAVAGRLPDDVFGRPPSAPSPANRSSSMSSMSCAWEDD